MLTELIPTIEGTVAQAAFDYRPWCKVLFSMLIEHVWILKAELACHTSNLILECADRQWQLGNVGIAVSLSKRVAAVLHSRTM